MKRVIFLFALLAFGMMVSAQAWSTSTSLIAPTSGILWGAGTHDTISTGLINTNYVIRLKSDNPLDIQLQAYFEDLSGAVNGAVIIVYGSNDGSNWNYVDSTLKVGSEASQYKFANIDDFNYSYIKLWAKGRGASGVSKINLWYSIRQE